MSVEGDAAARERIRGSLDESLLVEAAAGTGKTTELVHRLVALLASGRTTIDRVVAVTFTRKAAGELKLRLRFALDRAREAAGGETERQHLRRAISHLEEARIGTIHSFCADLLRERPVEAGIDPDFVELDEEEAERLYAAVFDRWIQDRLEASPEALRRALSRLALAPWGDESALGRLRGAGWELVAWRDHPAPWRRDPFDRDGRIDTLVERLHELATMAGQGPAPGESTLRLDLQRFEEASLWVRRAERDAPRDHDDLEARLLGLRRGRNRRGGPRRFGQHEKSVVLAAREAFLAALEDFRGQADADLAAALREELGDSLSLYADRKRREGKLDFLDLLLEVRDLLRDDRESRLYFQRRFSHLFVDEFQDTDPLQAEILLLLATNDPATDDWREAVPAPGKLFLVGDPKQSIYRFRRADVVLYQEVRDRLTERGVRLVRLGRSFRSARSIQRAVNAAFAPEMRGDRERGEPAYIPLEEHRPDPPDRPTLIALPAPYPFGTYGVANQEVERCLPATVAGFVQWLVEASGWTVDDPRTGEPTAIAPSHVAILFRRFVSWGRDVASEYARELELRDVPHVLVGSRSFHQREEVETLRVALTAVEHPDDEVAVFGTLKGSLFALPDDLLFRYRREVGPFHPFAGRDDVPGELEPVTEVLDLLADLHRRRNRVPVADTLHTILRRSRAHAGFALRPAGHQVLANVQQVADLARSFEMRGGLSFRELVERLERQAESVGGRQASLVEEGAEGVRLLTVHSAKGLEFPVVILADLTCSLARAEPSMHADSRRGLWAGQLLGCAPAELKEHADLEQGRDEAEGTRIAYVAATRARDLLVVTAVGAEGRSGWLQALNRALYPQPDRYHLAEPAPGCPLRGSLTVLGLGSYRGEPPRVIRPGRHRPAAGGPEVVWWDPATLDLEPRGHFGERQTEILAEDPAAEEEGMTRYRSWSADVAAARQKGSTPSVRIVPVTSLAVQPPRVGAVSVERVEGIPDRPRGARFGALVHAVLRDVPFDAGAGEALSRAQALARALDAPEPEIVAAAETVSRALGHPLLRQAARADRVLREVPFVIPTDDGQIVEGVVDLAFRSEEAWTVVDFKTHEVGGEARERYERQLHWYLWALQTLRGGEARGVILEI